jgi:RNA polymerase sigma-70 factor (ECF subfamily)
MQVARNKADDCTSSSRRTAPLCRHLSEPALLKRARARKVGAFEELVGRTEVQLYRVAMRVVRNESDAQEILQESYLCAWRSLPKFEGRSQFGSWMHRIVINNSLMHLRTRNRHPEVGIHDVDHAELDIARAVYDASVAREGRTHDPDQQLQSKEALKHIENTVNALPDKLKEIFLLREVRELSNEDAAARLGVSKPAAKTRLHRARRVLRQTLGDYSRCLPHTD